MQARPGHQQGADRCSEKQEGQDQNLVYRQPASTGEIHRRAQQDAAHAECRGLGRPMQSHEKARQLGQPQRAEQDEHGTEQDQRADDQVENHCSSPVYSTISPRIRYLLRATVVMKPSTAINRAASKLIEVSSQMPSATSSEMALTDRVSSASTRSIVVGPLSRR